MEIELKELVKDSNFVNKINNTFADLRADYELSMDNNREKISELRSIHVDNKNFLADLVSYSKKSSGVISGLRGTGKTHLFMIAREEINETIFEDKVVCFYLNLKRLYLPENYSQEIFNRIFSIFLYNEISKQLLNLLNNYQPENLIEKFSLLFENDKRKFLEALKVSLYKIAEFKYIAFQGNETLSDLEKGKVSKESFEKDLMEFYTKLQMKVETTKAEASSEMTAKYLEEISNKISSNNTYLKYLNIQVVREQLVELLKILKLNSFTFYVDEWEKLYYSPTTQQYLSFFIDRIIDEPLFFWIGVVPNRGESHFLELGSDLQHSINLDESLIFENSSQDRNSCIAYFKEFINRRLFNTFKEQRYNYDLFFNNEENFELLVLASMGNSREFGTMLLNCWSEYKAYRINLLTQGRPFKYISRDMVTQAIKNNGDKKIENIKDKKNVMAVWRNIEKFAIEKKSSHFVIEESKENMNSLQEKEFSELIYHRLLHFRKGRISSKDTDDKYKLALYALNYASSFDLHSKDKQIEFITESKTIHDRVRRYIYNPQNILKEIKIKEGEVFPCSSCKEEININKMKGAWETNSCPFCAGKIRTE